MHRKCHATATPNQLSVYLAIIRLRSGVGGSEWGENMTKIALRPDDINSIVAGQNGSALDRSTWNLIFGGDGQYPYTANGLWGAGLYDYSYYCHAWGHLLFIGTYIGSLSTFCLSSALVATHSNFIDIFMADYIDTYNKYTVTRLIDCGRTVLIITIRSFLDCILINAKFYCGF